MSFADVDDVVPDVAPTRRTLYVGGLSIDVTEEIVRSAFQIFGELVDVTIPPPVGGIVEKTRRFAFVEFEDPEDALCAKDNMNDSDLYGRIINVKYASDERRRQEEKPRPGSIMSFAIDLISTLTRFLSVGANPLR